MLSNHENTIKNFLISKRFWLISCPGDNSSLEIGKVNFKKATLIASNGEWRFLEIRHLLWDLAVFFPNFDYPIILTSNPFNPINYIIKTK